MSNKKLTILSSGALITKKPLILTNHITYKKNIARHMKLETMFKTKYSKN